MIEQLTDVPPTILGFKLSGKLHDEDYKLFVPAVDKAASATWRRSPSSMPPST
jgi:hypothetical protein